MNNCVFIGRIASDITMRTANTASGSMAIASFSLAVKRDRGDETDFFGVTAFGKTAENINKFFSKGSRIALTCSAQLNKWTDRDGNNRQTVQFVVNSFEFIEKKSNNAPQNNPSSGSGSDGFMNIPDGVDNGEGLPFT